MAAPFMKARVEVNSDPENRKRVRVRVMGIHPFNAKESSDYQSENDVPNDVLPWAEQMIPPGTGKVDGGYGSCDVPDEGDWVWVFFEDEAFQRPWYVGIINGKKDVPAGFKQTENAYRVDRWRNEVKADEDGVTITLFAEDDKDLKTPRAMLEMKKNGSVKVLSYNADGSTVDIGGDSLITPRSSAVNYTYLNQWMTLVELQVQYLWLVMFGHTHGLLGLLPCLPCPIEPFFSQAQYEQKGGWKDMSTVEVAKLTQPHTQSESKKLKIPSFEDSQQVTE